MHPLELTARGAPADPFATAWTAFVAGTSCQGEPARSMRRALVDCESDRVIHVDACGSQWTHGVLPAAEGEEDREAWEAVARERRQRLEDAIASGRMMDVPGLRIGLALAEKEAARAQDPKRVVWKPLKRPPTVRRRTPHVRRTPRARGVARRPACRRSRATRAGPSKSEPSREPEPGEPARRSTDDEAARTAL